MSSPSSKERKRKPVGNSGGNTIPEQFSYNLTSLEQQDTDQARAMQEPGRSQKDEPTSASSSTSSNAAPFDASVASAATHSFPHNLHAVLMPVTPVDSIPLPLTTAPVAPLVHSNNVVDGNALEKTLRDAKSQFKEWKNNNTHLAETDAYKAYLTDFTRWEEKVLEKISSVSTAAKDIAKRSRPDPRLEARAKRLRVAASSETAANASQPVNAVAPPVVPAHRLVPAQQPARSQNDKRRSDKKRGSEKAASQAVSIGNGGDTKGVEIITLSDDEAPGIIIVPTSPDVIYTHTVKHPFDDRKYFSNEVKPAPHRPAEKKWERKARLKIEMQRAKELTGIEEKSYLELISKLVNRINQLKRDMTTRGLHYGHINISLPPPRPISGPPRFYLLRELDFAAESVADIERALRTEQVSFDPPATRPRTRMPDDEEREKIDHCKNLLKYLKIDTQTLRSQIAATKERDCWKKDVAYLEKSAIRSAEQRVGWTRWDIIDYRKIFPIDDKSEVPMLQPCPPSSSTTTQQFVEHIGRCLFCEQQGHAPEDCRVYDTIRMRELLLLNYNRCRLCLQYTGIDGVNMDLHLQEKHKERTAQCNHCKRCGHHTALCKELLDIKKKKWAKS